MLKPCTSPLWEHYDLAMLDLDGVVYVGPHAVPGVDKQLAAAAAAGMRHAYVTNNASRPPAVVASHLRDLGVPAETADVVTSAQAAARLLADQLPAGSPVFVLGGPGLFEALEERGLVPVQSGASQPAAVVSGYSADLRWGTVSEGAMLVKNGLPWVASNTDLSVPTPQGNGPGNGVLVDAVARFAGRTPVVAGKPMASLFEETQRRVGGQNPLVVGDRLDTDIEGAVNAGLDSLLVLTGVTGLRELVAAPARMRPSYISPGLEGLGQPHPVPVRSEQTFSLGGWRAEVTADALLVAGEGAVEDWWRVVAEAAWAHLDAAGAPADVQGVVTPR